MNLPIQETYWDKKSPRSHEFQVDIEIISTVLATLKSFHILEFQTRGFVVAGAITFVT
jgi:hypothetical protein